MLRQCDGNLYHLDRGRLEQFLVNLPTARCPHVPHVYDLGRKCPPKLRYHDAVRLLRESHRPGSHRGCHSSDGCCMVRP